MPDIDAKTLERLQEDWAELALDLPGQHQRSLSNMERIAKELEKTGLDLAQDATYQLLDPGLTKERFEQAQTCLLLYGVLDTYHRAGLLGNRNGENPVYGRFQNLKNLTQYALPEFEKAAAKTGTPAEATPLMLHELVFIRQLHLDGVFEQEIKKAACGAAVEHFRVATQYYDALRAQGQKVHNPLGACKGGLAYAGGALDMIGEAQDFYSPADVSVEPGRLGWGRGKKTARFERSTLETYKRFFTLKKSGIEFKEAKGFQDRGHFELDASDSGHGMMVMPMQDILSQLQENGCDIADPQTYKEMGTNIDTFRACYRRERSSVAKSGDKYSLMKPEIRI